MYLLNYKPKYFYDASLWHHLDSAAFLSPVQHLIARHTLPCSRPTTSENSNKSFALFRVCHYHYITCTYIIHIAVSSAINQVTYLDLCHSIPTFHSNMMRKSTIIDSLIDGCDFNDMLALFLDHPAEFHLGPFCGFNPIQSNLDVHNLQYIKSNP